MGSFVKLCVLVLAFCASVFLLPLWFPKLLLVAWTVAGVGIVWGWLLAAFVVGGGMIYLKVK